MGDAVCSVGVARCAAVIGGGGGGGDVRGLLLRLMAVVATCAAVVGSVGSVGCQRVADVSEFAGLSLALRDVAGEAGVVVSGAIRRVDGGEGSFAEERFVRAWDERLAVIDAMGEYAARVSAASRAGSSARDGVMDVADGVLRLVSAAGLGGVFGGGAGGAVGGVVIEAGATIAELIASVYASETVAEAVLAADPLVIAVGELLALDIGSMGGIVRVSHEEARARVLAGEVEVGGGGAGGVVAREVLIAEIAASEADAAGVLGAFGEAVRAWAVSHAVVAGAIGGGGEVDFEGLIEAVERARGLVDRVRVGIDSRVGGG